MLVRQPAAVRRADSAPAVLFIIAGIGLFAILGLTFAVLMLAGLRKSAMTGPAPATRPAPAAERFGGLLRYCPPDATAITAINVSALIADPAAKDVADLFLAIWRQAHGDHFDPVPLSAADVEAVVIIRAAGIAVNDRRRGTLTAVRFKHPVEPATVLRNIDEKAFSVEEKRARDDSTYYLMSRLDRRVADLTFSFPNDRTMLLATTPAEIEEAARRKADRSELRGSLRDVIEAAAGTVVDATIEPAGPSGPGEPGHFAARARAGVAARDRRAAAVWFTVRGDHVDYGEVLSLPDSARAAAARDALRREFGKDRAARPGDARAAGADREFAAAAEVGGTDSLVTVTATVRRPVLIDALQDLAGPGRAARPPKR